MASGFPSLPFLIFSCIKAYQYNFIQLNVSQLQPLYISPVFARLLYWRYMLPWHVGLFPSIVNVSLMLKRNVLLLSVACSSSFIVLMASPISLMLWVFTIFFISFNFNFLMKSPLISVLSFPVSSNMLTQFFHQLLHFNWLGAKSQDRGFVQNVEATIVALMALRVLLIQIHISC